MSACADRYDTMSEAPSAQGGPRGDRRGSHGGPPPAYAALDLGTNNCRLLVATPTQGGFRVVEAYSRIVRLGEGLTLTGRMSDEAMERALAALTVCAEKVRRRKCVRIKAIATQACRQAENGEEFIARVASETGLRLQIITPKEEAQLSVAGCVNLLDRQAEAALVVDVGGGSTELNWLSKRGDTFVLEGWMSAPVGVVTLAERHPEPAGDLEAWYEAMVVDMGAAIADAPVSASLRELFVSGRAHMVGTSGAITSLAGIHLGLRRYQRNLVDGLWMTRAQCEAAADTLKRLGADGRAAEPCIGPDRADLVLAGAAIMEAVQRAWPSERVRVADRGLREGLLLQQMREDRKPNRRRRRGRS